MKDTENRAEVLGKEQCYRTHCRGQKIQEEEDDSHVSEVSEVREKVGR